MRALYPPPYKASLRPSLLLLVMKSSVYGGVRDTKLIISIYRGGTGHEVNHQYRGGTGHEVNHQYRGVPGHEVLGICEHTLHQGQCQHKLSVD